LVAMVSLLYGVGLNCPLRNSLVRRLQLHPLVDPQLLHL
jgi:hypothetical protein